MTQHIPLVDLQAQYSSIHREIDGAIRRVVESAQFIMGPDVAAFEQEYAAWCSVPHCVGVGEWHGGVGIDTACRWVLGQGMK